MKFLIDLPRLPIDCGECPCSEDWGDLLICNLEEHESCVLKAYMPTEWSPFGYVLHPRPEWCPLVTIDDYETEEYLKVVNSQLTKDEELVELRMELYESEYDALQLMAWKSRLTMAQQVAKLIEEADRE